MTGTTFTSAVRTHLTDDYNPGETQIRYLYDRARKAQWNADTDVDWSVDARFGTPLPAGSPSATAAFESSPMARGGWDMWDRFRWETQSWMVSQFLHGEQGALVVAARLVEVSPGLDSKLYAATQVVDEARHVDVFARYLREQVPEPYPVSAPLESLLTDVLNDSRWDVTALGMQIMVEALALAAFRLADQTFHDPLIRQITRLVARDEARHVSFGVISLEDLYQELTSAELADREDLVLEAAYSTRRRFLLGEVWDRLGVDRAAGIEYAENDSLMIIYRRAIFSRVVSSISRIGLMSERVRDGLDTLDLLGFANDRTRSEHRRSAERLRSRHARSAR